MLGASDRLTFLVILHLTVFLCEPLRVFRVFLIQCGVLADIYAQQGNAVVISKDSEVFRILVFHRRLVF